MSVDEDEVEVQKKFTERRIERQNDFSLGVKTKVVQNVNRMSKTEKHAERQTDRQTDGPKDRQADR